MADTDLLEAFGEAESIEFMDTRDFRLSDGVKNWDKPSSRPVYKQSMIQSPMMLYVKMAANSSNTDIAVELLPEETCDSYDVMM